MARLKASIGGEAAVKGGFAAPTVAAAGVASYRRVEHIMGMPIVLEICDDAVPDEAVERCFRWLRHVDAVFSTYKPDSEISRLRRGEITLADASFAVRSVLRQCAELRERTGGYFDAEASGALDPSGLVKGWAIAGAGKLLQQAGTRSFSINAGGDVLTRGQAPQGGPWRIGIQHPLDRNAVAAVVGLNDGAVATSGAYERGRHVIDPHTTKPCDGLLSATVLGPDIATADAYATAAYAMGSSAAAWLAGLPRYCGMVIDAERQMVTTPGFNSRRLS